MLLQDESVLFASSAVLCCALSRLLAPCAWCLATGRFKGLPSAVLSGTTCQHESQQQARRICPSADRLPKPHGPHMLHLLAGISATAARCPQHGSAQLCSTSQLLQSCCGCCTPCAAASFLHLLGPGLPALDSTLQPLCKGLLPGYASFPTPLGILQLGATATPDQNKNSAGVGTALLWQQQDG